MSLAYKLIYFLTAVQGTVFHGTFESNVQVNICRRWNPGWKFKTTIKLQDNKELIIFCYIAVYWYIYSVEATKHAGTLVTCNVLCAESHNLQDTRNGQAQLGSMVSSCLQSR